MVRSCASALALALSIGCTCGAAEVPPADSSHALCDAAVGARVGYRGYLGAARSETRLATETGSEEERAGLCAEMRRSLDATAAYLAGYRQGVRAASSGPQVVHVHSETLLPDAIDAEVHCRQGRPDQTIEILAAIEREVEADFERQLDMCKDLGWSPPP